MFKPKWVIAAAVALIMAGTMIPASAQSSEMLWVNSSQDSLGVNAWQNFAQLLTRSEYQIIGQGGQPYWNAVVMQVPETASDIRSYYYSGVPAFGFYAGPGQRYVVYIQPVSEQLQTGTVATPITPAQPSKSSGKKPNSLW